jgi:hypothetical protein
VLVEGERLLGGWTLFAPAQLNVKFGEKFEEKVLLLVRESIPSICSISLIFLRLDVHYILLQVELFFVQ